MNNYELFCVFKKAQLKVKNKEYKEPKDITLKGNSLNNLETLKNYFLTKWSSIDPYKYFEIGFQLFKNFSYNQFLNEKIIEEYKRQDKNKKINNVKIEKSDIISSVKFVLKNNHKTENDTVFNYLKEYCKKDDYIRKPINDYINNNISTSFLCWLIKENILILTEEEKGVIPYILNNQKYINDELNKIRYFLNEVLNKKILKKK